MFSGDDVFKKLGVLSGGERNRYAMAKMLVSPSNMLLLDEPTNHLDLRAKDVLLDAIRNFTGTVLFVSHDRYFIDGLASRVFEVEDKRVHIYPGNYEDYLWRKQGGPQKVKESLSADLKAPPTPAPVIVAPRPVVEPATAAAPAKRLNPIKLKQMEDRLKFAEEEIPRLEQKIAAAEGRLGNFTSAEQSQKDAAELDRLRSDRTTLLTEWEELSLVLEEQRLA
jgi:ATP-binding cassette subfamily F protein 3